MDAFLKQVARRILTEHPDNTDRVLVVFNNHRSQLFLQNHFQQLSMSNGATFFLPKATVIDDMVSELSGLEIVKNEFLLFELYTIHIELGGDQRKYQTFEEFISFGDMMLGDFFEIDRYCVDADDIFLNLHNLKAVGEWDIESPNLSDRQRQYLDFYHSLSQYYHRLHDRLLSRQQAYAGMAYRHVAENISSLADRCNYEHIYFVGFNALSECERRIIGEYVRRGKATLLTDGDTYYYDDRMQEAGYFLRKHSREFDSLGHYGPSLFGSGKKEITIVECPENVLQCKYTGQLLSNHRPWLNDAESTAIVLADESLLIPTLNALPDNEDEQQHYKVNISMGFNFADSTLNAMVTRLLALYRRGNDRGYYHTDLLEAMSDLYLQHLAGVDDLRRTVGHYLEKESRVRCTTSEIANLLPNDRLLFLFPESMPSVDEVLDIVRRLCTMLTDSDIAESNLTLRPALESLIEIVDYIERLQADYHYIASLDTLERIYSRIAQRHSISFIGKPLQGLQILGMLETRNLDFKHVILLSTNEGVLPSGRGNNTMIPHELKRHFGLPTYEEQDSVYAYHFYRLLQRAEKVYLLYSSETESAGKGEESRFIKQVRNELAKRFPDHITLHEQVARPALHSSSTTPHAPFPEGQKTEAVMQRIAQVAERGFSPTALNNYIDCPLKYYYSNLLRINESDTVEDDIDSSQLGECVHNILKHIYEPCIGHHVTTETLGKALRQLPELMDQEFGLLFRHGRSTEGRNEFLRSVAQTQLTHVLRREKRLIEEGHRIDIVALEEDMEPYTLSTDAQPVRLAGRVDRIDRLDGHLRIIDYKTGRVDDSEISIRGELDEQNMPGKWLQLMCYTLIFRRMHGGNEPVSAGIYPLRNLQSGVKLASWDGTTTIDDENLDAFEHFLHATIDRLMDPNEPFSPTTRTASCTFCPVRAFCRLRP